MREQQGSHSSMKTPYRFSSLAFALASVLAAVCCSHADDWPQWMGPQRDGVWRAIGLIEELPTNGPTALWRTNVNRGYVGPAVVGDRLA